MDLAGDGYLKHYSSTKTPDRKITPQAIVDALDLYSLLIKVKEKGLDMKCMHSENLGCISFLCRSAQWRYKEQSLVSNVHKHKLSLLRVMVSREYRKGSRRLWCQWCHLWADIPIMAWSMSHPPLSVTRRHLGLENYLYSCLQPVILAAQATKTQVRAPQTMSAAIEKTSLCQQ